MYKCLVRNGLLSRAWRLVVDQAINYSKFKDHSCRILRTLLSAFMERNSGLEISYQVFPSCIPWHGVGKYCQRLKRSNDIHWLVVLTILKNISQWEGLSHILYNFMENKKWSKPPTRLMSDLGLSEHRVRIQWLIITVSSQMVIWWISPECQTNPSSFHWFYAY